MYCWQKKLHKYYCHWWGTISNGTINYNLFPGIVSNLVGNNNTCTSISSSSYLNSNVWLCNTRWYCVVITFDGSRHKVYIDGTLKVDQPTSFNGFLSCNSEIRLGNWWQLDMLPFKGKIDDVRWYNRALNQSEVNALLIIMFHHHLQISPIPKTFVIRELSNLLMFLQMHQAIVGSLGIIPLTQDQQIQQLLIVTMVHIM
jgi:hypothetical protein